MPTSAPESHREEDSEVKDLVRGDGGDDAAGGGDADSGDEVTRVGGTGAGDGSSKRAGDTGDRGDAVALGM